MFLYVAIIPSMTSATPTSRSRRRRHDTTRVTRPNSASAHLSNNGTELVA